MPNNVGNMLRAARRSMEETISPSIDPANPLAREQAQLVIQALKFVEQQLPYLHAKDRFEMIATAAMADEVLAATGGEARLPALARARDEARRLEKADNPPSLAMQATTDAMNEAMSDITRALADFEPDVARQVRAAIVSGTAPILELHRSFFLPTGFDRASQSLPDLATLLHGRPAPDTSPPDTSPPDTSH